MPGGVEERRDRRSAPVRRRYPLCGIDRPDRSARRQLRHAAEGNYRRVVRLSGRIDCVFRPRSGDDHWSRAHDQPVRARIPGYKPQVDSGLSPASFDAVLTTNSTRPTVTWSPSFSIALVTLLPFTEVP